MLELLFVFGVCAFAAVCVIGLLKLLVALVILPFKIAFFVAKGFLGLLLIVPALIIGYLVITNVFPIVLFLLILPVILAVAALGLLLKLILCA